MASAVFFIYSEADFIPMQQNKMMGSEGFPSKYVVDLSALMRGIPRVPCSSSTDFSGIPAPVALYLISYG